MGHWLTAQEVVCSNYYGLVQGFRVIGLFAGQYNTKIMAHLQVLYTHLEDQQVVPPT